MTKLTSEEYNFVQRVFADLSSDEFLDNFHIQLLCAELSGISAANSRRLCIALPPRSLMLRDNQDESTYCLTDRCSRAAWSLPHVNAPLHLWSIPIHPAQQEIAYAAGCGA
jgi:hypothetical protein